jgi:hypothetical protein
MNIKTESSDQTVLEKHLSEARKKKSESRLKKKKKLIKIKSSEIFTKEAKCTKGKIIDKVDEPETKFKKLEKEDTLKIHLIKPGFEAYKRNLAKKIKREENYKKRKKKLKTQICKFLSKKK